MNRPARSKYLVLDRDTIFSAAVVAAIESLRLEAKRTSFQSPWQNGVAERFVGTVRRDLLDHAIVLDDEHLRRLLSEYLAYNNGDRTHLGVKKCGSRVTLARARLTRYTTAVRQVPTPNRVRRGGA